METKICSVCRVEKDLSEYSRDVGRGDGRMSCCKKCYSLIRVNNEKDKKIVERAKINALKWNKFRESLSNAEFTRKELSEFATIEGLKYTHLVIPILIKRKIIEMVNIGKNGIDIYSFKGIPIHYAVFVEILKYYEYTNDKYRKPKTEKSIKKAIPISKMGISLQENSIENDIINAWNNCTTAITEDELLLEEVMGKCSIDVILKPTVIIKTSNDHEKDCLKENFKNILDYFKLNIPDIFDSLEWRIRVEYGFINDSQDKTLVDELRKRGYDVTAKKTIEL